MLLLNAALVNLARFNLISYLFVKIDLFDETSVWYPFASSISSLKNRIVCRTRGLRGVNNILGLFACPSTREERWMCFGSLCGWVCLLLLHQWSWALRINMYENTNWSSGPFWTPPGRGGSRHGRSDRIGILPKILQAAVIGHSHCVYNEQREEANKHSWTKCPYWNTMLV